MNVKRDVEFRCWWDVNYYLRETVRACDHITFERINKTIGNYLKSQVFS